MICLMRIIALTFSDSGYRFVRKAGCMLFKGGRDRGMDGGKERRRGREGEAVIS